MLSGAASSQSPAPSRSLASILIVDDHPANLRAMEAVLDPLGQRLVSASSGEEALARLREEEFAVVLLDVMMPGIDGLQTAQQLRAQAGGHGTPIIFLTAGETPALEGYALGAVDFLRKPLDAGVLRAKVAVFVELFRAREQLRQNAQLLAEQKRAAQARNAALLNASLDAIIGVDHRGRITEFNRTAEVVFGRCRDEALGHSMPELLVPEAERAKYSSVFVQPLASGPGPLLGQRVELDMSRADGTTFPVEFALSRVGSAEPPEFLGYVRDISVRRAIEAEREALLRDVQRARAEAEAQRSLLHAVVEQAPAAIAILRGPEHRCELSNPVNDRLLDQRIAIGESARDLSPEDEGRGYAELLDRVLATGETIHLSEIPFRLGARETFANVVYGPLRGADGSVEGVLVFGMDVTEQVLARHEVEALARRLRASEDRLRLALEAADLGTWDWDPVSGQLTWDERCRELMGVQPSPAPSYADFIAALHPRDRAAAWSAVERAMDPANNGSYEAEYRVTARAGGAERWLASRGRAFFDPQNRPVRLLATVMDVSARKQAEAERTQLLARAEQALAQAEVERVRLHALLMQLPALISIQGGADHVFEFVNARYRAFAGHRELEGKPLLELPELATLAPREVLDRVLATGQVVCTPELHARVQREQATVDSYFNVVYQPLFGIDGRCQGVMTFAYDITEQVWARQELEVAEARFRRIFESNMIGFVFTTSDGRVLDANDYFLRLIGFSREELRAGGIRWDRLTPPEYASVSRQLLAHLHESDVTPLYEKQYFHKAGNRVSVMLGSARLPARTGAAEFVTFVLDVSDRKALEVERERLLVAARAGEEQFRTLADTMPLLAWYAEPDGYVPWYNRRWHEYTGLPPGEPAGWQWQSVHDPSDLPRILERWHAALARGTPFEETFRLRRHDGVYRWFLTRVAPLRDASGRIVRWFGTDIDIDDQKRAEAALDRARREMAVILDTAGEGIYGINVEGRTTFVNPAAARMLGYAPDELHGRVQHDLAHHTRRDGSAYPQQQCPIDAALHERAVRHGEDEVFWRRDGTSFPVEYTSTPITQGGEVAGAVVVFRDITERKRAEQAREFLVQASGALAASLDDAAILRTVARLAVSHLADVCAIEVVGADPSLPLRSVARADTEQLERLRRLQQEQLGDDGALFGLARVMESGEPELHPEIADVRPEGGARSHEQQRLLRDLGIHSALVVPIHQGERCIGAIAWLAAGARRRYDAADLATAEELARRAAVAIQNARLYRATQAAELRNRFLAEATEILASSLEQTATLERVVRLAVPTVADTAAFYRLEADGSIRLCTLAASSSEWEELARELDALLPLHVEQADRVLPRVVRTGRSELLKEVPRQMRRTWSPTPRAEAIARQLDILSYMAVPLVASGRVIGAIALTTSVSGRRLGQDDLALAEELARRAGLAVENAELYREAQEASRLKDEFLATISHELRTPLTAILGWTHLLRSRRPTQVARALDTIERNAKAQARIIEDVLDVSRIITGKLRLQLEMVNLAQVVQAAIDTVRPAAEAKGIELSASLDAASDTAGDAARLQQVAWNLLSNAIKFTPKGGRVEVWIGRDASSLRLRVRDSGRGIRAEFLPHAFERFRQADSAATREHGGLGLGLAIVRHLVELHGGSVTAESEGEGRGATFTVTLPVRAMVSASDGDPSIQPDAPTPVDSAPQRLGGVRVLVVDDQADALDLVAAILEEQGAIVAGAASAREAMTALAESTPDVLVSDLGMPGEDGHALIRQVRELGLERGFWFPAVALTAYARASDRNRSLSAGYQVHLAKPIDPELLVETLARLAGSGAASAEVRR